MILNLRNQLLICAVPGICAAALVYLGDAHGWRGFNRREGYWGTHHIDSFLYAINDPYAIHIVAGIWFGYAFAVTFLLLLVGKVFAARARRDGRHPR